MILSYLPLAFTRTDMDGYGRTTPWFTIIVRDQPGDTPIATYAHERFHVSFNWRHPIATWTVKGDEKNEEIGHCVGALIRERYYGMPFAEGIWVSGNESINAVSYRRKGLWPDLFAVRALEVDDIGPASAMLAERMAQRRPEAEAWIAAHENLIARVAKRLGVG